MSVFLRWGVFGILGVAALLYAYNASKRLSEAQSSRPASAPMSVPAPGAEPESEPIAPHSEGRTTIVPVAPAVAAHCEAELAVARRAIQLRDEGAPLDRVLRMQEIAWVEAAERRQRLETVATRWFGYEGRFSADALRSAVVNACQQAAAGP